MTSTHKECSGKSEPQRGAVNMAYAVPKRAWIAFSAGSGQRKPGSHVDDDGLSADNSEVKSSVEFIATVSGLSCMPAVSQRSADCMLRSLRDRTTFGGGISRCGSIMSAFSTPLGRQSDCQWFSSEETNRLRSSETWTIRVCPGRAVGMIYA